VDLSRFTCLKQRFSGKKVNFFNKLLKLLEKQLHIVVLQHKEDMKDSVMHRGKKQKLVIEEKRKLFMCA